MSAIIVIVRYHQLPQWPVRGIGGIALPLVQLLEGNWDSTGSVAGGTEGSPPQDFATVGKPFRRRFSSPTSGETQRSSVSNFKKC